MAASTCPTYNKVCLDFPADRRKMFAYRFSDVNKTLLGVEHLLNILPFFQGEMFPAHVDLLPAGIQQPEDIKDHVRMPA